MAHEKVDEITANEIRPLQEEVDGIPAKIEKLLADAKVEDSKKKEKELRDEAQNLRKRQRELWNQIEGIKVSAFEKLLAEEYDVVGNPKFAKAYGIAWQHGHSSGFSDVENFFSDIVELIK